MTSGKIGKAAGGLGLEGPERADSAESFLFAGLALERSCHLPQILRYRGFPKLRYPKITVSNGTSNLHAWFGGTPISGNLNILRCPEVSWIKYSTSSSGRAWLFPSQCADSKCVLKENLCTSQDLLVVSILHATAKCSWSVGCMPLSAFRLESSWCFSNVGNRHPQDIFVTEQGTVWSAPERYLNMLQVQSSATSLLAGSTWFQMTLHFPLFLSLSMCSFGGSWWSKGIATALVARLPCSLYVFVSSIYWTTTAWYCGHFLVGV